MTGLPHYCVAELTRIEHLEVPALSAPRSSGPARLPRAVRQGTALEHLSRAAAGCVRDYREVMRPPHRSRRRRQSISRSHSTRAASRSSCAASLHRRCRRPRDPLSRLDHDRPPQGAAGQQMAVQAVRTLSATP